MEGDGRDRASHSDITVLQNSDLQLRYLTRDARKVVDEFGLRDLKLFYQVLLMELCYNLDLPSTMARARKKRDETPGISANALVAKLCETPSQFECKTCKIPKAKRFASFDVNGIHNLFMLDREVVIADYGVNLEDLAKELNKLSAAGLREWLGTIQEDKLPMSIALYKLQEFLSILNEGDERFKARVNVSVPKYEPIDEAGREVLENTLKQLRETEKLIKEDEDGLN